MESDWLMFDLPYDGKSVIHYKTTAFGKGQPPKTTIESKVCTTSHNQCNYKVSLIFDQKKLFLDG